MKQLYANSCFHKYRLRHSSRIAFILRTFVRLENSQRPPMFIVALFGHRYPLVCLSLSAASGRRPIDRTGGRNGLPSTKPTPSMSRHAINLEVPACSMVMPGESNSIASSRNSRVPKRYVKYTCTKDTSRPPKPKTIAYHFGQSIKSIHEPPVRTHVVTTPIATYTPARVLLVWKRIGNSHAIFSTESSPIIGNSRDTILNSLHSSLG